MTAEKRCVNFGVLITNSLFGIGTSALRDHQSPIIAYFFPHEQLSFHFWFLLKKKISKIKIIFKKNHTYTKNDCHNPETWKLSDWFEIILVSLSRVFFLSCAKCKPPTPCIYSSPALAQPSLLPHNRRFMLLPPSRQQCYRKKRTKKAMAQQKNVHSTTDLNWALKKIKQKILQNWKGLQ